MQGSFTTARVFVPVLEATLGKEDETPAVLVAALAALTRQITSRHVPAHALLVATGGAPPRALHLLVHASTSVRQAAVAIFAALAAQLDLPDLHALLRPALQAALRTTNGALNPLLFSDASVVRRQLD